MNKRAMSGVSMGGLVVAVLALTSTACSSIRVGYGRAGQIAKDPSLPGKFEPDACLHYARALHARFREEKIASRIVTFRYEALPALRPIVTGPTLVGSADRNFGQSGAHAIVVYQDEGRSYAIDNQSWVPRRLRDTEPMAAAQQFAGMDIHVLAAQ